jgi:hypothetical protein
MCTQKPDCKFIAKTPFGSCSQGLEDEAFEEEVLEEISDEKKGVFTLKRNNTGFYF